MEQVETRVENLLANIRLNLAAHVQLRDEGDGANWVLSRAGVQTCFQVPRSTMSLVLAELRQEGWRLDELAELLQSAGDAKTAINQLHNLWRAGYLEHSIIADNAA